MEFDWLDAPFDLHALTPKEIQESFEDPFSLRLLPEVEIAGEDHARYFNLGCSVDERPIFSIFWTDGKRIRVILARDMAPEEETFYTRKKKEEVA